MGNQVSKPDAIRTSIASTQAELASIEGEITSLEVQKDSAGKARQGVIDSRLAKLRYKNDQLTDEVSYLQYEASSIGMAKKPFEKSLGFMSNFAEHQQNFFEESSFTFSEFAANSDKSKYAYALTREAQKFWIEEQGFLKELKEAGPSRKNNKKLHDALKELFTLQIQMGSRFDADFENLGSKKHGSAQRVALKGQISEIKSRINSLHSGMGA